MVPSLSSVLISISAIASYLKPSRVGSQEKRSWRIRRRSPDSKSLHAAGAPVPNRAWDVLMMNARTTGRELCRGSYRLRHEPPPFVLVCESAIASRYMPISAVTERPTTSFPTVAHFVSISKICNTRRFATDLSLSGPIHFRSIPPAMPPRSPARSRDGIAKSQQALEKEGHATEEVAMFLMRVLFTMFAEDVEPIAEGQFQGSSQALRREA